MRTIKRAAAVVAVVSAVALTAACGSNDSQASSGGGQAQEKSSPAMPETSSSPTMDPMADLVGPGCAGYAKQVSTGPGSVQGMSEDPVATAASNNPLLKTLVASVSGKLNKKVNLVDTLNGGEFTVFAPVDSAFAKLPKATVKTLSTPKGAKALQTVLTYHVVQGQMTPDQVAGKTLTTVEGEKLKIGGTADDLTVGAGKAKVICGGVHTANATVYLIDSVLMPPSMA
ncbi:MAG: fasciclin domain-containing protein [Nocardioidaceae bacterium]|nr:fasciclin domain-containing protein [Nocardioidaceae bacterium]NUS49613.1 fasciclin domain-containing protein [Nocardioidaceae bacterium]